MRIKANISALGQSEWHEYVVRFVFGGSVTVFAGIVAKDFGPGIGGLFLAFPAIFPATATLIAKHEKQKKLPTGRDATLRAREAAGADAAGAAMGCVGLVAFAAVAWFGIPRYSLVIVLLAATLAWLFAAFLIWESREEVWRRVRIKFR